MKVINGLGLTGILCGLAMLVPILLGPQGHEKLVFAERAAIAGVVTVIISLLTWFTVGLVVKFYDELKNQ